MFALTCKESRRVLSGRQGKILYLETEGLVHFQCQQLEHGWDKAPSLKLRAAKYEIAEREGKASR